MKEYRNRKVEECLNGRWNSGRKNRWIEECMGERATDWKNVSEEDCHRSRVEGL